MNHCVQLPAILAISVGITSADIDRSKSKTDAQIDSFYGNAAPERGATAQRKALQEWQAKIARAKGLQPEEAIPVLSAVVRATAKFNVYQLEERIHVYDQARDALLAIPGHATYWTDQLKREQMKVRDVPLKPVPERMEYDRDRQEILRGVLSHLPSPESVHALGSFLWDDKDAHQRGTDDDWSPVQGNSFYAAEGLRSIGLRNSPQPINPLQSTPDVALWRKWYEEITSGKLAFSFEGQSIEYRFTPEGKISSAPIKIENRPAQAVANGILKESEDTPRWPWILAIVAVLGTAIAFWRRF